jgi:uncharacterized protein
MKRIDAYTHFMPLAFLDFVERREGKTHFLRGLFSSISTLVDEKARLRLLDQTETDVHILVRAAGLEMFPSIAADRSLAAEAARIFNNELAAVVSAHPNRFRGVAIVPDVEPDLMVLELHRAVKELGFVGVALPVGPTVKRMDHLDFDALFRAIVELDVTLWLHPSRPPIADYVDETRSQFLEWLTIGWLHDTTSAMYRIVFSGVFDRYPEIRIVTHHHGAFLPFHASRLEACWALFEKAEMWGRTSVSKPFIDHFRKFYCDTAAFGYAPKVLELTLDFFGPERVLFGSDAPMDTTGGQHFIKEALRSIEDMAISSDVRRAILSDNSRRILKFA